MNAALPVSIALAVFGVGGCVWFGIHLAAALKRIDRLVAKATDRKETAGPAGHVAIYLPPASAGFLAGPRELPAAEVDARFAALERLFHTGDEDNR